MTEEQAKAIISLARHNLVDYCCAIDKKYRPAWFHKLIASKLEEVTEGKLKRLMIFMPPRHGKSQLATINFPSWFIGKHPGKSIITCSYSAELATDFGRKVRNLVSGDLYSHIFPEVSLSKDSTAANRFHTNHGGQYTAAGVGGGITGKGCDVLIIDDPIKNREDADSQTIRDKVWGWYTSTAYTRLQGLGAVIVIQTRWHNDDLSGRLLEKMKDGNGDEWEVINLPAIATEDEEHRLRGDALWPDNPNLDLAKLNQIKSALPPREWHALFQQQPGHAETQIFHAEWFRYWEELPEDLIYLTVCDPAFKKKETSDYSVVMTVGLKEEKMYIVDITRGKYDPSELIEKIIHQVKKWKPVKVGVEAYAAQTVIGYFLQERLQEEGLDAGYEEILQKGSKEAKIQRLEPKWRNGRIFHHRTMVDLEKELLDFPIGKHDDIIDCVQMFDEFHLHKLSGKTPTEKYFEDLGIPFNFNEYGEPI